VKAAEPAAPPGPGTRPLAWREYAIEGALLGLFMVSAGLFGTLLEAPSSPLRRALDDPFLRRALMGLIMGATAVTLIRSPWGRRSGAHMNPAVTLTFLRLGKVARRDAVGYVAGQCLGGLAGVLLVSALAGDAFTQPPVLHVVTTPGAGGPWLALAAEVAISFLLMTTVLALANSYRLADLTPYCAGALVALYITFEAPFSGMSMNPARSLASAVPAGVWTSFWVYLVGPLLGMLAAAELYLRRRGLGCVLCAKLDHSDGSPCPFHCNWCRHQASAAQIP
jgi:aquaporin Z